MLLTSNIYQFGRLRGMGIWGANIFVMVDRGLTLIDTGFRGRSVHILKEIARLGYSAADIANIIITHHHADHTGSLAVMKEITNARVFAHGADAPYIDGRLLQPGPAQPEWLGDTLAPLRSLWSTTPVTVDVEVRDGEELPILGGTWLLHTPGHTPGSISVFIPNEGLVIVGDVLSNTYGLSLPSRAFTVDMIKEINSIKRVADLEFDKACFGHGLPLIRKARQAIANFAEVIESKYESA